MIQLPLEILPHQDRVLQERLRVASDVNKLEAFVTSEAFSQVHEDEKTLLNEQLEHMAMYLKVLDERVMRITGVKRYRCFKEVLARPMNLGSYNLLRGWVIPEDEDGTREGFLVEYTDGGATNHPDFAGYISWSPKEVFERGYREKL